MAAYPGSAAGVVTDDIDSCYGRMVWRSDRDGLWRLGIAVCLQSRGSWLQVYSIYMDFPGYADQHQATARSRCRRGERFQVYDTRTLRELIPADQVFSKVISKTLRRKITSATWCS